MVGVTVLFCAGDDMMMATTMSAKQNLAEEFSSWAGASETFGGTQVRNVLKEPIDVQADLDLY